MDHFGGARSLSSSDSTNPNTHRYDAEGAMPVEEEQEEAQHLRQQQEQLGDSTTSTSAKAQMEHCGRWLLSCSAEDAQAMQHTREFRDFVAAFKRLDLARRKTHLWRANHPVAASMPLPQHPLSVSSLSPNRGSEQQQQQQRQQGSAVADVSGGDELVVMELHDALEQQHHIGSSGSGSHHRPSFSFLQHIAADEIVLRIFHFLDSIHLVRATKMCSRFRELANRSAHERTREVAMHRQLNTVLQLLRAKEQIDGIATERTGPAAVSCFVRVPALLLSRPVLVESAGDPEYNGIYYCTSTNGNGFVFTKPRQPTIRVERNNTTDQQASAARRVPDEVFLDSARLESEVAQPGQLLRCIIAKRFSNETILWYLSKEVIATEDNGEVRTGDVTQLFSFWAKLMVIGDASPDICRYPSQSSILARHNENWQALTTTRTLHPPTVELLD